MSETRVIAIDPGSEHSAWCELHKGKPLRSEKIPNPELLERLRRGWDNYQEIHPSWRLIAIEMIASYGMPVGREVFETCLWIGRFQEAWEKVGGCVQLIYRREVKLFHCESARANDANIRAALIDRFGPGKDRAIGKKASPGPLYGIKGDCWSALAIALTVDGTR